MSLTLLFNIRNYVVEPPNDHKAVYIYEKGFNYRYGGAGGLCLGDVVQVHQALTRWGEVSGKGNLSVQLASAQTGLRGLIGAKASNGQCSLPRQPASICHGMV